MKIDFDAAKDRVNVAKHGLSLELAHRFDLDAALRFIDERRVYGEVRWVAIGPIEGRLHVLVYTLRGQFVRVISLRKANKRERTRYERTT